MQVVSDELRAMENAREVPYSTLSSSTGSLNAHLDDWPAKASAKYDRLPLPTFLNRPRKRFKRFAAIAMLLLLAFAFSGIYEFPRLTFALEVALAVAAFSIIFPIAFSLLGSFGGAVPQVLSENTPKSLRDRDDASIQAPPFHSSSSNSF